MSNPKLPLLFPILLGALAACGESTPPAAAPPAPPPAASAPVATDLPPPAPVASVAPPAPAPAPVTTGPVPVSAEAKSFKLGSFTLIALRDAKFVAANDNKVIGVGLTPATVADALRKAGLPEDRIELSVGGLLVQTGKNTILLDSGLGDGAHGSLSASLKAAGVAPASVTDIFITHSHFDHVGGLVTSDGALAFPKATIRLSNKEWAALKANTELAKLVAVITPRVKAFEPGKEIVPGVTAVALYGHTPGHVGYEIKSGNQKIFDIGDLAHSSVVSLSKPDWTMGFDADVPVATKLRHSRLEKLAKDGELVFAPHFPFPSVGYVNVQDDGFTWKAQVPGE